MTAQVQKIRRPRIWPLWPVRVSKTHPPVTWSLWPFAMPIGLTILPSLEAARLYPWWVATLVFNAVWITLKLCDDLYKDRCSLFRRALMAISIVILADTMVLATTIDVCRPGKEGCLRAFLQKPVQFAAGFVPEFTRFNPPPGGGLKSPAEAATPRAPDLIRR